MANDVRPGVILATVPVQGGRAPTSATDASGKTRPQKPAGGKLPPPVPVPKENPPPEKTGREADLAALAERLGQYLRESGRAIAFRVENSSGRTVIHEIDPDTGEVIAEITSDDLMSLAKGLGLSGTLVNSRA
jgi:flagellar protein FlaG